MSHAIRTLLVSAWVLTCLACANGPVPPTKEAVDPNNLASVLPVEPDANIIIISFDALRADALGIYGYPLDTSPNIDRFAQGAVVFDRAYSAAPVTPTSFAAAFTARWPFRSFQKWNLIPSPTLAGALTESGYKTAALINNSQVADERNFGQGFVDFRFFNAIPDEEALELGSSWLVDHRDEKLFLWLHFLSPHSPYEVRPQSAQFYDPDYEGPYKTHTTARFETDDPKEIARIRSLYDGEIFYVDQLFGQLMDVLESQGLLENSIVVLTADHGEEFYERGGFQHRYLFEETVRIPMIVHHPRLEQGLRTQTLYSNVDLWPTLAAMVGARPPEDADGRNLLAPADPERAISSVAMTDGRYRGINLLKGNEKLILDCIPEMQVQLYDLNGDPSETVDLAEEQPGKVRNLLHVLRLIGGVEDPCKAIEEALAGQDPTAGLSPETVESLRALGYLQ